MKFAKTSDGKTIECFTPTTGVTLSGTYTPVIDEVFKLGADVVITLDSISVAYKAGDEICLRAGIAYTFATSTPAHKM